VLLDAQREHLRRTIDARRREQLDCETAYNAARPGLYRGGRCGNTAPNIVALLRRTHSHGCDDEGTRYRYGVRLQLCRTCASERTRVLKRASGVAPQAALDRISDEPHPQTAQRAACDGVAAAVDAVICQVRDTASMKVIIDDLANVEDEQGQASLRVAEEVE
jgi:hypothetical protein